MNSMHSWLVFALILVASPVLRKTLRWILKRVVRWTRWTPLLDTVERLSWVAYPLALHLALENAPLSQSLSKPLFGTLYVAYVFIILGWAREFAFSTLDWSMRRAQPSQILKTGFVPLLRNTLTLLAGTLGLILVLQHFGFDVLSLVTALGVGSLAVGLAAKDTLSNMISGFTLIIDRNFQPGERISISGCSGEVEEIGLRSTRIRTPMGTTWIVPNAELVNTKILNLGTPSQGAQVTAQFRLTLDSSFSKARELAHSLTRELSSCDPGRPTSFWLQALNDGAQVVSVSFWVRTPAEADSALSAFFEKWIQNAPEQGLRLAGGALAQQALT
jgi:MscS family membrane protein